MIHPLIKGGTALLNAPEVLSHAGLFEGAVVADLGCGGAGHFVAPTALLVGSSGAVYAVDIQKTVLHNVESRAKIQNISNVTCIWGNAERERGVKIENAACDFVFLANILFQNADHAAIIKEAKRILKSNGKLVIIEWKKTASPLGPPLDFRVDSGTIERMALEQGLKHIRSFNPGLYHFGFIFSAT